MAGHSLLFALTEVNHPYAKIILYDAPEFFPTCSLNSTAIVASRGVTAGHSELGDLLVSGFKTFSEHVKLHSPDGIELITQLTGTSDNIEQFRSRYPESVLLRNAGDLQLKKDFYLASEDAYEINPVRYLNWLRSCAQSKLNLEIRHELFKDDALTDEVVFCSGAVNSLWKESFSRETLKKTRAIQGSYLEFTNINLPVSSFSLTLDGHNLIYLKGDKILLIGSTTHDSNHYLAPVQELQDIHQFFTDTLILRLPDLKDGTVKVGLREKGPKRLPYLLREGRKFSIGGFYKNGFSLSLEFSRRLCRELFVS